MERSAEHFGIPFKHSYAFWDAMQTQRSATCLIHMTGRNFFLSLLMSLIVSPLISGFFFYFYRTQHSLLYNSAKMHLYLPSIEHYFPNNSNATGFTTDVNIYQNIPKC